MIKTYNHNNIMHSERKNCTSIYNNIIIIITRLADRRHCARAFSNVRLSYDDRLSYTCKSLCVRVYRYYNIIMFMYIIIIIIVVVVVGRY